MRVMVMVMATKETEARPMTEKVLKDMGAFNEELAKAGVLLACEGLHGSAKGKRVRFKGKQCTVIDGPFMETKEFVGGYWLWQVKSMDEAVAWLKRGPFDGGEDVEVELRPMFEVDDFGTELTPELRAQQDRLSAEAEQRSAGAVRRP